MRTIALRFGEHFAPTCGTIAAHQEIIDNIGYVWYGKMGSKISDNAIRDIMSVDSPKILLIRSGYVERYWAFVEKIQFDYPDINAIPKYYRDQRDRFGTWIKILKFVEAPKDIMSKCIVTSSGQPLGNVSKHSMSPYFKISYDE